jgi:hypothetical protein
VLDVDGEFLAVDAGLEVRHHPFIGGGTEVQFAVYGMLIGSGDGQEGRPLGWFGEKEWLIHMQNRPFVLQSEQSTACVCVFGGIRVCHVVPQVTA